MGIKAITGKDTLTLFDRVFADLADDDLSTIEFPDELFTVKTGKNQNTIYALNATGQNCELTLRLIRGSDDDKFMQSKIADLLRDPASFSLAEGEFAKRIGDGSGNVVRDIYELDGGIFTKPAPGAKENSSGDTEQAVAIYNMKFSLGVRSHQ